MAKLEAEEVEAAGEGVEEDEVATTGEGVPGVGNHTVVVTATGECTVTVEDTTEVLDVSIGMTEVEDGEAAMMMVTVDKDVRIAVARGLVVLGGKVVLQEENRGAMNGDRVCGM